MITLGALLLGSVLLAPAEPAADPAPLPAPRATTTARVDPRERLKEAEALLSRGRKDEALASLLWCFDRGAAADPVFYGQRMGRVLDALTELARTHPPARKALVERRNAAEARVLSGRGDWSDATDLATLSQRLGDVERAIDALVALTRRGPSDARDVLHQLLLEPLLERRRYAEIVASAGDVVARVDQLLALAERTADLLTSGDRADPARLQALGAEAVENAARYYEALLGAGDLPRAREVAELVMDLDPSPETFQVLVAHARRAGRPDAADALLR